MKPKFFLLLVTLFVFSFAHSQNVKLGIKGGVNMNKLSGESFSDEFSYGYHAGGFMEIALSKRWALQPELLFSEVNYDTTSHFREIYGTDINKLANIKLSYLSIPILAEYKLSKKVSLQAGPQFGILIDQNEDVLTNGENAFKKGDFSMVGGIELKFASITMYGRYAIGLNNINELEDKSMEKPYNSNRYRAFIVLNDHGRITV